MRLNGIVATDPGRDNEPAVDRSPRSARRLVALRLIADGARPLALSLLVLPFMLAAGSDNPTLKTINIVGMRRAGISDKSIDLVKTAFRMLYRKRTSLEEVRQHFEETLDGIIPLELSQLLNFIEQQRAGKLGRAREAVRNQEHQAESEKRKAA